MNVLANLVVIVHLLAIVAILLGFLLALMGWLRRHPWVEGAYLFLLAAFVISFGLTRQCFLTPLEKSLRGGGYHGGFVSHYLGKVGIAISDTAVFWTGVGLIGAGILAVLAWHLFPTRQKSGR